MCGRILDSYLRLKVSNRGSPSWLPITAPYRVKNTDSPACLLPWAQECLSFRCQVKWPSSEAVWCHPGHGWSLSQHLWKGVPPNPLSSNTLRMGQQPLVWLGGLFTSTEHMSASAKLVLSLPCGDPCPITLLPAEQ